MALLRQVPSGRQAKFSDAIEADGQNLFDEDVAAATEAVCDFGHSANHGG